MPHDNDIMPPHAAKFMELDSTLYSSISAESVKATANALEEHGVSPEVVSDLREFGDDIDTAMALSVPPTRGEDQAVTQPPPRTCAP